MALVVIFFSQPKTSCPEEVFQDAFPRGEKNIFCLLNIPTSQFHSFHPRPPCFVRVDFKHSLSELYKLIQAHNNSLNENFQKDARRSQKSLPAYLHVCTTHIHCKRRTFFLPRTIHVPSPRQLAFQTLTRPSTIYYYHHQSFSPCLVEHTTSRLPTPSPTLPSPNKTKASVIRMA